MKQGPRAVIAEDEPVLLAELRDTLHKLWPELVIVAGSFGFFCQFFLIFLKLFPVVAIAEVKEIEIHAKSHHAAGGH